MGQSEQLYFGLTAPSVHVIGVNWSTLGGGGVKKVPKTVHVVCACPLNINIYFSKNVWTEKCITWCKKVDRYFVKPNLTLHLYAFNFSIKSKYF